MRKILALPETAKALHELGFAPAPPMDYAQLVALRLRPERQTNAEIIRSAGRQADRRNALFLFFFLHPGEISHDRARARTQGPPAGHSDFVIEIDERIEDILANPDAIEQVRRLCQDAPVIVFPRQSLEEADRVRFTEQFGHCESANCKDIQSPYHDEIIYFSTLRYADGRFVGGFAGGDDVDWHSDQTLPRSSLATGAMLYGLEVP